MCCTPLVLHKIIVEFPDIKETVELELSEDNSPKTVDAILKKLPIKVVINRWGDELYTEPMPVKVGTENAKSFVDLMDVAYWPQGSALCLFYGPTPISEGSEIKPYSPVNILGRIVSKDNMANKVTDSTNVIIRKH